MSAGDRARKLVRAGLPAALSTAAAALALALVVGGEGPAWDLLVPAACLALVLWVVATSRLLPGVLPWALGLLLATSVAGIGLGQGGLSPLVLPEAAAIYVAAEIGWVAMSPPQVLAPRRVLLNAAILVGSLLVGYLGLFGQVVPANGGPVLTLVGVGAAIALFFLLRGRRRPATSRSEPRSP